MKTFLKSLQEKINSQWIKDGEFKLDLYFFGQSNRYGKYVKITKNSGPDWTELEKIANYKKRYVGMFAVDMPRFSSKGEINANEIIKNCEKLNEPTIFDADTTSILDEIHDSVERLISDEESRLPKQCLKVCTKNLFL